jgi:hypothetical protein
MSRRQVALLSILLTFTVLTFAQAPTLAKENALRMERLPITFEKNVGQASADYSFIGRAQGVVVRFGRKSADFQLGGTKTSPENLTLSFAGAEETTAIGEELQSGSVNYLIGRDSRAWKTKISTFGRVRYRGLYKGVDLLFYGNGEEMEHDFVVAPGADPRSVRLKVDGAKSLQLQTNGDLAVRMDHGDLVLRRAIAYQKREGKRVEVAANFEVVGNEIRFHVGDYDRRVPLVIDPALGFATYLADTSLSGATLYLTADSSGNSYVTTLAWSNFPTTAGAFQPTCASCGGSGNYPDVVVMKLNAVGNGVVYSTYLGGNNYDQPFGIAVDGSGKAVVTGYTNSPDFPTKNSVGSAPGNYINQVGFITSLSADGSAVNYSSLLGSGNTLMQSVAADASGNAYAVGVTSSAAFPYTAGALNNIDPGSYYPSQALVLVKLSPTGALLYGARVGDVSSYSGGTGVNAMLVDGTGAVYLAGVAGSSTWPTTAGAYSAVGPGVFVAKISANASQIVFSTFVGQGSPTGVAIDSSSNVLITGNTYYTSFPLTNDAAFKTGTAFLAKLNPTGTQLLYSSFTDDSTTTNSNAIALDASGNIWLGGWTGSQTFPMIAPIQTTAASNYPERTGWIQEWDSTGKTNRFSSYFGGIQGGTTVNSLAIDGAGKVHLGGTASYDLPTTSGAYRTSVTPPPPNYYYLYGFAATIDPLVDSPAVCTTGTPTFGAVLVGTSATSTVTVTNCGKANLQISAITPSVNVLTVPSGSNHCSATLAPNATCTFDVKYSPTSEGTLYNTLIGTVTIQSNAIAKVLPAGGYGALPHAALSTNQINFGPVYVGTKSNTGYVVVNNTGSAPLSTDVANSTITGDFSFTADQTYCTQFYGSYDCYYLVTFTPSLTGTRTGSLVIPTNDSAHPTLTVNLQGTGFNSYPVPVITDESTTSLPISATPMTVDIYGTDIYPASTVKINGVAQTVSPNYNYVRVTVPASFLSSMGELTITVSNPAPGGGDSQPITITVYNKLTISASATVYNKFDRMIYAAIGQGVTNGNSVVPIDPSTGTVGTAIPVGTDPNVLAISNDGAFLYVGTRGSHQVQRINLLTKTIERTFDYPLRYSWSSPISATKLLVVPGSPTKVLALSSDGLALFDDNGLVNYLTEGFYSISDIAFAGNSSVLYALPFVSYNGVTQFEKFSIDSTGVQAVPGASYVGQANDSASTMVSDGRYLFTNTTTVWDPLTGSKIGKYLNNISYGDDVVPDNSLGLTFAMYYDYTNNGGEVLQAFDKAGFTALGKVSFASVGYSSGHEVLRWGTDGFSLINTDTMDLYLFRSSIAHVTTNSTATPAIGSLLPSSAVVGRGNLPMTVTGTNFLPGSTVTWSGSAVNTDFVNSTTLKAYVPASAFVSASTVQVGVTSPNTKQSTTTAFSIFAAAAQLSSPQPRTTLPGPTVTFTWNSVASTAEYWIWIGTTPGGNDIYNQGQGTNTSATISSLPTNDVPVYVRLFTHMTNGEWRYTEELYQEAPSKARMFSPSPSSTLTNSTVTFSWSAASNAQQYWIWIGKTAGGYDIYNQGQALKTSATISGLPADGSTIYVRLFTTLNGQWQWNDYIYQTVTAAALTYPSPGTVLSGSTSFSWNQVNGASQYYMWIGTALGGTDIYSAQISNGYNYVDKIPSTGQNIYVRLFTFKNSTWIWNDYTFATPLPKPVMQSPSYGTLLPGSTATFTWTGVPGAQVYWMWIGTTQGGNGIYNAGQGLNTTATVSGLPLTGSTIWVRLFASVSGAWSYNDYAYQTSGPAVMYSPSPSTVLFGTTTTFNWSQNYYYGTMPTLQQYWIWIGTSRGGYDIYNQSQGKNLNATISGLPGNGVPLYLRLFTQLTSGEWLYNDYSYTAATARAAMLTPQPTSTLSGPSATFTWSSVPGTQQYWMWIGTSPGGNELYNQGQSLNTSANVAGLPTNGATLYVRLFTYINNTWQFNDYQYIAFTTKAIMTSPTPGSTISGGSMTLTWSSATGTTQYWLWIGTVQGGTDLYNNGQALNTSATISGLPTNGTTVFVRLFTYKNGQWLFNDYSYATAP